MADLEKNQIHKREVEARSFITGLPANERGKYKPIIQEAEQRIYNSSLAQTLTFYLHKGKERAQFAMKLMQAILKNERPAVDVHQGNCKEVFEAKFCNTDDTVKKQYYTRLAREEILPLWKKHAECMIKDRG